MLISSEYKVASDSVNKQIDELNTILKKYDKNGMLIGEAPCMKDMMKSLTRISSRQYGVNFCNLRYHRIGFKEHFPAVYSDCRN